MLKFTFPVVQRKATLRSNVTKIHLLLLCTWRKSILMLNCSRFLWARQLLLTWEELDEETTLKSKDISGCLLQTFGLTNILASASPDLDISSKRDTVLQVLTALCFKANIGTVCRGRMCLKILDFLQNTKSSCFFKTELSLIPLILWKVVEWESAFAKATKQHFDELWFLMILA